MNSLEFIDLLIKSREEEVNRYTKVKNNLYSKDTEAYYEKEMIGKINEQIQLLQKIKSELEAWYVVKPNMRFEEHSHAWIYLNRIYKGEPVYSVIEKELLKNDRSITAVTKEGNKITVKRTLEVYDDR